MSAAAFSQRLRSSGAWAASGRILSGVFLLVLHAVLARGLSRGDYGRYVLIESISLVLSLLCMAGIPTVTLRMMRSSLALGDSDAASVVVKATARLFVVTSVTTAVVTTCISLLLADFLPSGINSAWLPWFLMWAVLSAGLRVFSEIYRAIDRYSAAYLVGGQSGGLLLNASMVILSLLAVASGRVSLMSILAIQVVVQMGLFSACMSDLWSQLRSWRSMESRAMMGLLLLSAWPLLAQQLVSIGLPEAGKLLLGFYASPAEAGYYNAALRLVILAHVPLMVVNNAIQPFITELHSAGKKQQLTTLVRGAATLASLPCLAVFGMFLCVPQFVLENTFGASFTGAAQALRILTLGSLVWALSGSCGLVLMMTGHERACMMGTLIPGIIYLILCPWLIGQYGYIGAAIGATLLQFVSNGLCMLLVYRYHGFWTGICLSKTVLRDCIQMVRKR